MAVWLVNLDAAVLDETLDQLNALLEHVVPGVVSGIGQSQVLAWRPLLKQDGRWIFATEQSRHRLFEAAAKKHGGAGVFFLPAVEIAMAVTARAGQVLGNLGVAVIHHDALSFPVPLPLPAGGTRTAVASYLERAMAVTARAGQVLGNLGVAVIHHDALSFPVPLPLPAGGTRTAVASYL